MVNVFAKLRVKHKEFEISVDFNEAMNVRNGKGNIGAALLSGNIFYNAKSGEVASQKDLVEAFGTADVNVVATEIIKRGELQQPQEFRDAEREAKVKQVINLLMRNAVDQHGRPYTEDRLKRAIQEVHFNFDNRAPEKQLPDLIEKLSKVIPIKVETKKIKLRIPARFSGSVYGMLKDYKESEEWLSNGDLQAVMNIPAGMQLDFYDKLNSITHGAVMSEEIKE